MRLLSWLLAAAAQLPLSVQAGVPLAEAAFTEHMATRLQQAAGAEPVTVKGPLTLSLGELQANLDRVHAYCVRQAGDCEAELKRYVQGVAQVLKDRNTPVQAAAVRVVVRTADYVQAARTGAGGREPQLQPRPIVPGLVALPVVDSPRTVRMLSTGDNSQLGLTEAEVHALGLRNLHSALPPLMEVAEPARRGEIASLVGDTYDPSRLLLVDSWKPLVQAQGGTLIAVAPATDALFYIAEDHPAALQALRDRARRVMERAPNPLSDLLLRWTEAGWVLVR